jgi:hypothetical protein
MKKKPAAEIRKKKDSTKRSKVSSIRADLCNTQTSGSFPKTFSQSYSKAQSSPGLADGEK